MELERMAAGVRDLYLLADDARGTDFGVPYTQDIVVPLRTAQQDPLPSRRRVRVANVLRQGELVIGWQQTTLLRGARATAYERERIGLDGGLTYAQLKHITVHPDHRRRGLGVELFGASLCWAKGHGFSSWVADVKAGNDAMRSFLEKHGVPVEREWDTRNGSHMLRYRIEF